MDDGSTLIVDIIIFLIFLSFYLPDTKRVKIVENCYLEYAISKHTKHRL